MGRPGRPLCISIIPLKNSDGRDSKKSRRSSIERDIFLIWIVEAMWQRAEVTQNLGLLEAAFKFSMSMIARDYGWSSSLKKIADSVATYAAKKI
jgi:hypothetical protein